MSNYLNGKIYTIRFYNSNEIYIGSTIQSLSNRLAGHRKKNQCSSVKNIIEEKYNNNWGICYIELYENYSCNNREELHKREGEIIREFKTNDNYICLNQVITNRTKKERYENNKDEILNKCKEWEKNNKEYRQEYHKYKYENNKDKINEKIICECGCEIYKRSLKKHQQTKKHLNQVAQNNYIKKV
jgi:hypothetical protein